MTSHSSILGGSNAERLLACPASYQEQLKAPVSDVESVYAAEGTALHAAIALCWAEDIPPEEIVGDTFDGFEITVGHADILRRALDTLKTLLVAYKGKRKFRIVGIEEMLPLPGVTGAFGSVDLILANDQTIIIVDWKFGQGVIVKALYASPDGDRVNPQCAFYAAAARARYKVRFRGKRIVLAIIQPKLETPVDFVETDDAELDDFLLAFQAAYLEALGRDAHREKGEWCRFALCKATCPLWTGPIFDLAVIDPAKAALKESVAPTKEYGAFLSHALHLASMAETWAEEIRRQAHTYMEDGGRIPDWKVVPKRASRKWIDEAAVPGELTARGATEAEIFQDPAVRSVAQMEKVLKKRGIQIPDDLYHAVSSGTTVAPADDPRPVATRAEVVVDLRKALKALQ